MSPLCRPFKFSGDLCQICQLPKQTENCTEISVRPKPGFGIVTETKVQFRYQYRRRNFFSETETFFSKKFNFFFIFLMISHFIQVFISWKKTVFKNNLKIFNIWQQIWFCGPFYDGKNTHTIGK